VGSLKQAELKLADCFTTPRLVAHFPRQGIALAAVNES
jgi:hypothetical protein